MEQYYAYQVKKSKRSNSGILANPPPVGTALKIQVLRKIKRGTELEVHTLSVQVGLVDKDRIAFWIGHKWVEPLGRYLGYACEYTFRESVHVQPRNNHPDLAHYQNGNPVLYNESLLGMDRNPRQMAFLPIVYMLNYERARREALYFLLIAPHLPLHRNVVPQIARFIYESYREEIKF